MVLSKRKGIIGRNPSISSSPPNEALISQELEQEESSDCGPSTSASKSTVAPLSTPQATRESTSQNMLETSIADSELQLLRELVKLQQKQLELQAKGEPANVVNVPLAPIIPSRPKIQLEIFYGFPSEDVEDWINRFELLCQHNMWDSVKRLQELPLYLGGSAILWFRSIGCTLLNYETLKAEFIEFFASIEPADYALERLLSRVQGDGEPLETYAPAIQGLCIKVDKNMPDRDRMKYFLKGLIPSLKQRVVPMQPSTFRDAYKMARLHEHADRMSHPEKRTYPQGMLLEDYSPAILEYHPNNPLLPPSPKEKSGKTTKSTGQHRGVYTITKDNISIKTNESELLKKIDNLTIKLEELEKKLQYVNTRPNMPTCSFCKKMGHKEETCWTKNPTLRNKNKEMVKPSGSPATGSSNNLN
jgi:hypothetical protein